MARLTIDPTVLDTLGPIAGVVFVHWRNRRILRRTYRDSKASASQLRVRSNFAYVDDAYTQTQEQTKELWRAAAKPRRLTGYTYWMRTNIPRGLAGLPLFQDPP